MPSNVGGGADVGGKFADAAVAALLDDHPPVFCAGWVDDPAGAGVRRRGASQCRREQQRPFVAAHHVVTSDC